MPNQDENKAREDWRRAWVPDIPMDMGVWNRTWLVKGFPWNPVPGTAMIDMHGVRGYLTPGNLIHLFNLMATLTPGGHYLEVGSWMGLSAITGANGLLAQLNLRATVHCVDTWEGSPEHAGIDEVRRGTLYEVFMQNVRKAAMESFIETHRGRSLDIAQGWTGPKLDTINIDGDHSMEGTYADIKAWLPHLAPDGRLVGHDASPNGGVHQALQRLMRETGMRFKVFPPPQTHYIWEMIPS